MYKVKRKKVHNHPTLGIHSTYIATLYVGLFTMPKTLKMRFFRHFSLEVDEGSKGDGHVRHSIHEIGYRPQIQL